MQIEQIPQYVIGGFTLAAYRKNSELTEDAFNKPMPFKEWPQEITMRGVTYTLEEVKKFDNGFENAEYV